MDDFQNPSVEDIILGFQFQATFDLPGNKQNHRVTMGVLWNSELIDVSVVTGRKVISGDYPSRTLLVQQETLVQAVTQIDDWVCYDPDNSDNNIKLKGELRALLGKSAPPVVEFLWECYQQLRHRQDGNFAERTAEIKKSLRSPNEEMIPELSGSPPTMNDS